MKVSIAGCGHFSGPHIGAIKDIEGLNLVAVCDKDPWRAREVASLHDSVNAYDDLEALLKAECPDVVHILTPPGTHADLSIQAMKAGCHVLVEKPMALCVKEANRMIAAAKNNGVTLSTDHNYLFNPSITKARQIVAQGDIGQVVYVDAYYGLAGGGSSYTSISGRSHWAWRLPGSAFTNFLPHLIYLQLAFLPGETSVAGVTVKQGAENGNLPTELTVLLQSSSASGVMAVSMRAKPYAKFIDIYGTRGIIHADLATEVCTIHKTRRLPGMFSKVLFNLEESAQLTTGTMINTAKVATGIFKKNPGLINHIESFYACLRQGQQPYVSGEDGRKMIAIMEEVWSKAPSVTAPNVFAGRQPPAPSSPKTNAEDMVAREGLPGKVLVTGATGFLGNHLVAALSRCDVDVVAMVRDGSRVSSDLERRAEIVTGNLRDPASLQAIVPRGGVIFHCAAVTTNYASWSEHYETTVLGTKALLEASLQAQVKRIIHVSSVLVYGLEQPHHRGPIQESDPYAINPDQWAYYMRSKIEAEKLTLQFWEKSKLPVTAIRLGILYGPGSGRSPGRGFVQIGALQFLIGSGRNTLPYTYVGNAVDSLLFAAVSPNAIGQAYNVVDEPQVSWREVANERMEITDERSIFITVPPFFLSSAARILEWKRERNDSQSPPKLSRFVVRSACRNLYYDTTKARDDLGWQTRISLTDGLRKTLGN